MCAVCFTEASEEQNAIDIRLAYHSMKIYRSLTVLQEKHKDWLKVWPDDTHIFYRSVDQVEPWLNEDQIPIYTAFLNCEPMPYT
jgi:hypothetical protein